MSLGWATFAWVGLTAIGAQVPVAKGPSSPPAKSCIETLTQASRPKVQEKFPEKGESGYALELEVEITHGKGQNVLPSGFRLQREGPAAEHLKRAGFILPDPEGSARPEITVTPLGDEVLTRLKLPFLALPQKPGRQILVLPSVPIALSRASGEVVTLCTSEHSVTIEDPIANVPDPQPKPNPAPRRQLEEWKALSYLLLGTLAALVVAALAALLMRSYLRRPKRLKKGPPPKPAWEVARQKLFDLRHAGLLEQGRTSEHYERATNVIREYLGARFDFDGLECTSYETLVEIKKQGLPSDTERLIQATLLEADLVKFARASPSVEQCHEVLAQATRIVESTVPVVMAPAVGPEAVGQTSGRSERSGEV